MKNFNKKNIRIGEKIISNSGLIMTIIEYKNNADIIVKFEDGTEVKTNYSNFLKGKIASPYEKNTSGVGYLGIGKYSTRENNELTLYYLTWSNMLRRCYNTKIQQERPSYIGCSVCDEWLCYQTFAKWMEENYYEIENEKIHLDKDILIKGNKIYSPETCIFAPEKINTLILNRKNNRGSSLLGVYFKKDLNKFIVQCNDETNKQIHIGCFNFEMEAFQAYKNFKESIIKKMANEYKNKIPEKLYQALINYQVEITD